MFNFEMITEKNRSYINTPNIFARLLYLKKYIQEENSILIIVENEKAVQNYLKISGYLSEQQIIDRKISSLKNTSQIIDIIDNKKWLYISTPDVFYSKLDIIDNPKNILKIEKNQDIAIEEISKKLNELWYTFKEYESPGSFKISWDTLHFTSVNGDSYKVSFWGNTIEEILDVGEKKNIEALFVWKNEKINLIEQTPPPSGTPLEKGRFNVKLKEKLNNKDTLIVLDSLDFSSSYDPLYDGLTNFINLPALSQNKTNEVELWLKDLFVENIDVLKELLKKNTIKHKYVFTKNIATFKNFIEFNDIHGIHFFESSVNNMKSFQSENSVFICDDNISRIFIKKRGKRSISKDMDLLLQIKPWDYIVHIDHWIGIFKTIIEKDLPSTKTPPNLPLSGEGKNTSGVKKEYIELEYKNNDKLFVPITEVGRLSKYVWVENPKLTPLSTKAWETKLKKASVDIEKIARELLDVYAKRKLHKWFAFSSFPKEEWIFQNSFEYTYTKDQFSIIQEIFGDMESQNPMDRLLSWDVGFWKTEIAFNAMYKAMLNGKQTALISPLVVLAYEHFDKAQERFKDFPFNIEVITRFEKESKIKEVLKKLKSWKIDAIIGTHRLLSSDIQFKDLGLLVVDEEHKFGVADKEKIKNLKGNIDILSMSATPIPRSLNLALNGIKSISMLTTPPVGRQSIHTIVSNFSDKIIQDAGKKEFERGGQLFFIHNRVETISHFQAYLEKIFPSKKIIVTHWQLPGDTLEKRIIDFKRKQYDILLSTTVIENWIDFSNVNTIIINEAGNFWISQIHQLRWRVWRGDRQWYCYLLFKKDKIKQDAAKRLKTIVDYSHLWAGFELAIKDLEIRWGWDILGIRQSGQSVEIGVNLFLQMLESKVEELKNSLIDTSPSQSQKPLPTSPYQGRSRINTKIDLNISIFIDNSFFSSELDKINFYREIESLNSIEDLESIISDFRETALSETSPHPSPKEREKNSFPKWTNNFFDLLRLKILANKHNIRNIKRAWLNYQIDFVDIGDKGLEKLKQFLELDKEVKFRVISLTRIRSETKKFTNDESFVQYLLQLFSWKIRNSKIKLKMRK